MVVPSLPSTAALDVSAVRRPPVNTRAHEASSHIVVGGNPDRRGLRQLASGTQSLIRPVTSTVTGTEFGRSSCEPCGQPETLAAGRLGRAPRGGKPQCLFPKPATLSASASEAERATGPGCCEVGVSPSASTAEC